MTRTRTSVLRRAAMWAAGVALVVSVTGWVVSLVGIEWDGSRGSVHLIQGELTVMGHAEAQLGFSDDYPLPQPVLWRLPALKKGFGFYDTWPAAGLWIVHVPLWIPAAASFVVFVPTWFVGYRRWRRHRAGNCLTCGYDLAGITGPCPECGKQP